MIDHTTGQPVSTVDRPPRRTFRLLDAMVLIATTAVGLAFVRYSRMKYFAWEPPVAPDRLIYHTLIMISRAVYGALPVLYGLCAAVVVSSLGSTGSRRKEFTTIRPGIAACTAALVALLTGLVFRLLNYAVGHSGVLWSKPTVDMLLTRGDAFLWSPPAIDKLLMESGPGSIAAVFAVWGVQCLSGLWRPVPEWPDRLGRALGWLLLLWALTPL
jgi:hypothetical protein